MKKFVKYDIVPERITISVGEQVALAVLGADENGNTESIGNVVWQEVGGGGHIDNFSTLFAINPGKFQIVATVRDTGEGEEYEEKILSTEYEVIEEENGTVASALRALKSKRGKGQDTLMRMEIKKEDVPEPIKSEAEKEKKKGGIMAQTRAIFRTARANPDMVWLFSLIVFCVVFGCCTIMLMSGISVEKLLAFLGSFFAMIISIFGRLYSPPGEITQDIQDKMLGASDEEKIKNIEKKIAEMENKVRHYSTKKGKIQEQSWYKYSITEKG